MRLPIEERKRRNCARSKKWYHENKRKAKSTKLFSTYGITIEQYDYWNGVFGHVCHICGGTCPSGRRLAVDHDHSSGLVRGLLCINCNKGLGNFKDNPDLFNKALQYLADFQETKKEVYNVLNSRCL